MNTEKLSNEAQNSPLRKGVVINWVAIHMVIVSSVNRVIMYLIIDQYDVMCR
jgi:hypothetical protein